MDNNMNYDIIEKAICKRVAIYKAIDMLPPTETKDLWEENKYTKQNQNNLKLEEKDSCVTMNETKNDSMNSDLKDTTKRWVRNCPKCNDVITYKYKCNFKNASLEKKICRVCAAKGKTPHNKLPFVDLKKNCSKCNAEITFTTRHALLRSIRMKSICKICNLSPHPVNYNRNACGYFDKLNVQNGWKLQHALNGGEIKVIGYSLDAYDQSRNIVVEYDEPTHYDKQGNLKQKDVLRQQRIITHLGCKFFRYNEKTKELYEIKQS